MRFYHPFSLANIYSLVLKIHPLYQCSYIVFRADTRFKLQSLCFYLSNNSIRRIFSFIIFDSIYLTNSWSFPIFNRGPLFFPFSTYLLWATSAQYSFCMLNHYFVNILSHGLFLFLLSFCACPTSLLFPLLYTFLLGTTLWRIFLFHLGVCFFCFCVIIHI